MKQLELCLTCAYVKDIDWPRNDVHGRGDKGIRGVQGQPLLKCKFGKKNKKWKQSYVEEGWTQQSKYKKLNICTYFTCLYCERLSLGFLGQDSSHSAL